MKKGFFRLAINANSPFTKSLCVSKSVWLSLSKRAFSSRLGKFALNLVFLRASKTPIKAPPLAFLKLMS